jgi:metal-responsive CopG/Arc/MetJ family transcriptional regulator
MTTIISIVLKARLLQHIDQIRGDVSRSKFISKLLEGALNSEKENKTIPEIQKRSVSNE